MDKLRTEQLSKLSLNVAISLGRIAQGHKLLSSADKKALKYMEILMRQEAELLIGGDTKLKTSLLPVEYILDIAGLERHEATGVEPIAALFGAMALELTEIKANPDQDMAKEIGQQYRNLHTYTKGIISGSGKTTLPQYVPNNTFDF